MFLDCHTVTERTPRDPEPERRRGYISGDEYVPAKWLLVTVGLMLSLLGGVWLGSSSWTGSAYETRTNAEKIADLKAQTAKDIDEQKKNVLSAKEDVMRVIELLRHDVIGRTDKSDADIAMLRNSLNTAVSRLDMVDLKFLYLSRDIPPAAPAPSLPGMKPR